MADRRGVLVPLIIFLYIILPAQQPQPAFRDPRVDPEVLLDQAISEEQRQLDVLGNSTWDPDFGRDGHTINITGLEPERNFAWTSLPDVKTRAREQLEYALGDWGKSALDGDAPPIDARVPLYNNVTGSVRGKWRRSKLQELVPIPSLNLTEYAPPAPFGQPGIARAFERNVTGDGGDARISFTEKDTAHEVAGINGTMEMSIDLTITDKDSYDEWEASLRGVYFTEIGQAILATTSDKLGGVFMLPHLALTATTFESARALLNESITRTVQRQIDRKSESLNPWSSRSENAPDIDSDNPQCDLVVYLQQMAPVARAQYTPALLSFLESELRFPTGAVLPRAPDLHFSMLAFSPDCGFVIQSQGPPEDFAQDGDHLHGPKREVAFGQIRRHLLIFTLILAPQLLLLMRQMREASTPSTRSRISYYTIGMLAWGDAFTIMAFLFLAMFAGDISLNLIATGFVAFISVAFFSMRFLMDLWQVQSPERERVVRAALEEEDRIEQRFQEALQRIRAEREARERRTNANDTTDPTATEGQPASAETNGDTAPPPASTPEQTGPPPQRTVQLIPAATQQVPGTMPLPALATRPADTGATPVFFMPSDQEQLDPIAGMTPAGPPSMEARVRANMPSFGSLYVKFYLLLFGTMFACLYAQSWPAPARRGFYIFIALCYLSFWIPQIFRNIHRNCRHALNWEFVLGQSALRMAPFAYVFWYKHNVLFMERDITSLSILALWVWVQVIVLISQEFVGPRWFIRSDWAPPAYDYHPILREDEEGATMPIGFSQAAADASQPSSPTLARRASIAKETKEKGKRIFDCAICMQDLEVPVIESGESSDAGLGSTLLARRQYMVTPCRHIFHSACLEGWMKYRLQCPICRETLPPL